MVSVGWMVSRMDDEELFERWVHAHQQGDTDALEECMAEGFEFEQEGFGKTLDKQEYLVLVEEMHNAFPDLGIEASKPSREDERSLAWQQGFSATHENDLDLTELGLPFFFSTGNQIEVEPDAVRAEIEEGRITRHVIRGESGGFERLLTELEDGLAAIRKEAKNRDPRTPER